MLLRRRLVFWGGRVERDQAPMQGTPALKYAADRRTLVACLLCALSYVLQWHVRDVHAEAWYVSAALLVPTGLQAFQQAVIVHNVSHVRVWRPSWRDWRNGAFELVLTLLSGAPVAVYQPGHVESHHKFLETERDVMRTCRMQYRHDALNILLFFPSILVDIQRNDLHYMWRRRREGHPVYTQFVCQTVALHALLAWLAALDWYRLLLVYLLPTLLGKYLIVTLNILQHGGCDPTSKYNHSRDFTGAALNYLLFNNGFHVEHHNSPGTHWSLLRQRHEAQRHRIDPRLVQPSLVRYTLGALCGSRA